MSVLSQAGYVVFSFTWMLFLARYAHGRPFRTRIILAFLGVLLFSMPAFIHEISIMLKPAAYQFANGGARLVRNSVWLSLYGFLPLAVAVTAIVTCGNNARTARKVIAAGINLLAAVYFIVMIIHLKDAGRLSGELPEHGSLEQVRDREFERLQMPEHQQ